MLLVNKMGAEGKQHRDLLFAYKLSVSQHLLAPSTKTWTMQKGGQRLDADSGASHMIKVFFGTEAYENAPYLQNLPFQQPLLCAQIEIV